MADRRSAPISSRKQPQQVRSAELVTALQDAASVAGLLITTEAIITEDPKKEAPMPMGGGGGGMGGMGGMDF